MNGEEMSDIAKDVSFHHLGIYNEEAEHFL
jgi:hypothetical protein